LKTYSLPVLDLFHQGASRLGGEHWVVYVTLPLLSIQERPL
jgi:hypothetical protein